MNDRIKELLLQAGFRVFKDRIVAADNGSSGDATVCAQRFAELIIRDCAAMTRNLSLHGGLAEAVVKERFGVK